MQDEQMIEALSPHPAQEALTDGIGSGCLNRRLKNLDATCGRHTSKARSEFAIVIPYQVLWRLSIGGGFSQLLGDPKIGWRACHAHLDNLARFQFDNEEGKQRAEEEIGDREKVAGPDLLCMSV